MKYNDQAEPRRKQPASANTKTAKQSTTSKPRCSAPLALAIGSVNLMDTNSLSPVEVSLRRISESLRLSSESLRSFGESLFALALDLEGATQSLPSIQQECTVNSPIALNDLLMSQG